MPRIDHLMTDDMLDPAAPASRPTERAADAWPGEERAFAPPRRTPAASPRVASFQPTAAPPRRLRAAIREDLHEGRLWMMSRVDHAREAVQDEPIRASLYALGAGVLIGLLLRR